MASQLPACSVAGVDGQALRFGGYSCTTIHFTKESSIASGDTTSVSLRFNPRGKSGEFYETGTLSLEGNCLSSEESLAQQFPVRITESLWISANRFDLGIMRVGESKERGIAILHRGETAADGRMTDRQELVNVRYAVDTQTPKGLQHVQHTICIRHGGQNTTIPIILDVLVK